MPKWSQRHTLNAGLIVIGLLVIASSGASLFASRSLLRTQSAVVMDEARGLSESLDLRRAGLQEVSDVSASLLTGEDLFARDARAGGARVRDRLARLKARVTDPKGLHFLEQVRVAERDYQKAFEKALLSADGRPRREANAAVGSQGRAFEYALDSLVARLDVASSAGLDATRSAARRSQALFDWFTALSIALAVVLCVVLILIINRAYRQQATARLVAEQGAIRTSTALREEKATSQLKDEFLATVSHELRNPLAPILTWTQLLRSGTLSKDKADRGLEVIERNVISLSELIDDLVDVSRVASGKFRLDVRPVDLVDVIRAAVESQRPASDARRIRLQLVLDERAGMISGDSERLHQVVGNLLSNAIKFTPKGGSVQVTLGRAESHVQMQVADTGIGIEPAFLPHVFEPFQQAMDGSMRRHGGLGLGLSIVRHIVELHGGEIIAESAGKGQGARFTVKLPLLGMGEATAATRPKHPTVADGIGAVSLRRLDGIRVLLVDDEPSANEAVETLLDACGAEVRAAGSAAQALQTLDTWRPDVLISDIAMPEEDGYYLIRKIRSRSAAMGGDVPAAALTAYAKIEDRVDILAAGFQMYLSKPADPSELIAVVASLATRRPKPTANSTQP
ncbi:MAG TPA: ATP-binding protein [Candidatus Eisenbacteria bacterium]|nr:ATP-binding protein [Candidatus Eisenbacteria bacterium]